MSRIFALARENGWTQLLSRASIAGFRRLRDSFTARKLHAPGFRAGHAPRLFGLSHMTIGRNLRAGDALWLDAITLYAGRRFDPRLRIGDDVSLSDRVHIACLDSVTIGSGTLIGSGVIVTDHAHGVYRGSSQSDPETIPAERPLHSTGAIHIGRNVWIGDGVAVLAGSTIGDGAVIGANSVVTGAIPAATIAVGIPARPTRRWSAPHREWLPLP